jgi:hypothetical protein
VSGAASPAIPRFNHVALTVPARALDAAGRAEILAFYGDVFGWTEMPTLTRDRELLVLRAHSHEQFVFLSASERPMRCEGSEHFGLQVGTPADLEALLARAEAFRARDPRVELWPRKTDDFRVLRLHSFYVRHLLPMQIEVQCYEWAPGFDAQRMG